MAKSLLICLFSLIILEFCIQCGRSSSGGDSSGSGPEVADNVDDSDSPFYTPQYSADDEMTGEWSDIDLSEYTERVILWQDASLGPSRQRGQPCLQPFPHGSEPRAASTHKLYLCRPPVAAEGVCRLLWQCESHGSTDPGSPSR